LFWSCIDVIVVRVKPVKVSRGIEQFSPIGINSADTSQPPNGEICMDKSHLLSDNPAGSRYTSVPLEAAPQHYYLQIYVNNSNNSAV
jgi:hypothetical protein